MDAKDVTGISATYKLPRMPHRIDHVAVAVADLDAAISHYRDLWGMEVKRRELVKDQGVEEAMLPLGDTSIQLLGATGPDTTVGRFLRRRGEGLHHLAYQVEDLVATLAELKDKGIRLIDEQPRRGGGGHMIAFVHPEANHGLLVELIQRREPL